MQTDFALVAGTCTLVGFCIGVIACRFGWRAIARRGAFRQRALEIKSASAETPVGAQDVRWVDHTVFFYVALNEPHWPEVDAAWRRIRVALAAAGVKA